MGHFHSSGGRLRAANHLDVFWNLYFIVVCMEKATSIFILNLPMELLRQPSSCPRAFFFEISDRVEECCHDTAGCHWKLNCPPRPSTEMQLCLISGAIQHQTPTPWPHRHIQRNAPTLAYNIYELWQWFWDKTSIYFFKRLLSVFPSPPSIPSPLSFPHFTLQTQATSFNLPGANSFSQALGFYLWSDRAGKRQWWAD